MAARLNARGGYILSVVPYDASFAAELSRRDKINKAMEREMREAIEKIQQERLDAWRKRGAGLFGRGRVGLYQRLQVAILTSSR